MDDPDRNSPQPLPDSKPNLTAHEAGRLARAERGAAALRANLLRRKHQARARAADSVPTPDKKG
jgi:hypothetical protein